MLKLHSPLHVSIFGQSCQLQLLFPTLSSTVIKETRFAKSTKSTAKETTLHLTMMCNNNNNIILHDDRQPPQGRAPGLE
jgi:hypothetical protein